MAVQSSTTQQNFSLVLSGDSLIKDNETLLTDAGRTDPLEPFTVLGKVAASGKWVPLTDLTATDGTGVARGIYLGDTVTAAALADADVTGAPVLVGGFCTVDSSLLVFENSLTAASVGGATTIGARTVEDDLRQIGVFLESTIDIDALEN